MAGAKTDYYDILGVSKSATEAELKSAYRKQAVEWHPDKHKDNKEAAEKRFKEINEAYQILGDSEKRAAYDRYGHQAFSPNGAPGGNPFAGGGAGGRTGPFTWTYQTGGTPGGGAGFDFGDPFEIFEQFFGGGRSPFGRQRQMPRYSITIDFMEAVHGVEKEVEMDGKSRKIKIPAGVDEGSRIQFGDFILSINVKPHDKFERDGADVYVTVDIPYSTAVLGGSVNVPTVSGDVKLKVRTGTQSGTLMRLRGKGAPQLRGRGHGDEYVKLRVEVPGKLNRNQKKIIQELEEGGL